MKMRLEVVLSTPNSRRLLQRWINPNAKSKTIMSKELAMLTVSALDNLQAIFRLQELLEICLEELDSCSDKTYLRLELLINAYQTAMELYTNELEANLENMRKQLYNTR